MCTSILRKSLYLIEISCHQSGTRRTRKSNSELIDNQCNYHNLNHLCSMRTSLLALALQWAPENPKMVLSLQGSILFLNQR